MIPEFAIREWSEHVPWTESEQVEQDLLICRALTEIYKDEYLATHLAFRGGTALHKLFLSPQPRYSEDIDLVQINAEPIKETYDHIRDALAFLGEPKVKQKKAQQHFDFQTGIRIHTSGPDSSESGNQLQGTFQCTAYATYAIFSGQQMV